MHRRTWDAKMNAAMVIQGLRGRPVAAICHAYRMSQSLSDQWLEQCLAQAPKTFEVPQHAQQEGRLEHAHSTRKKLVGEWRLE